VLIRKLFLSAGEHHYYNMDEAFGPNGTANLYSTRDLWKVSSCLAKGITLIVITFWYLLLLLLLLLF
jgi:hypothetical protein